MKKEWIGVNCIVTGGASFIGSHLVEELVRRRANVKVIDDLSSGKIANLSAVRNQIAFSEGDLKSRDFALRSCTDGEVLFHLAADHGGRGYISTHPASCAGNMALDNTVFGAAVDNGVDQIVFASSACVYPTDIQEGRQLLVEEMVDFKTRGGAFADEEYGWAKLMGELSLKAYNKQYGVGAVSCRLSTAYGPRESESHAIIALIAKAFIQQSPFEVWGNGEQSRGFTYVDDIVSGIILAAENITDGSAVNVGTSDYVSINQITEEIFKVFDWRPKEGLKHLNDRPVGVRHRALDGSFAQKRCGWMPKVSLEQGVRQTIEWYVDNRDVDTVGAELENLLMMR